jgi:hypothetical protein
VVEHFNASQMELEPLLLPDLKSNGRSIGAAATVTIWPQNMGGYGMFIAGWRRKK